MVLESTDENNMMLITEGLQMDQPRDLNLFVITAHKLVTMSQPKKGVQMEIKFKRKIMSEMMTTYLPSFLLMMITFATTFFKPFFFDAALGVNLTTMLVMTTIFISKMESLPPTSDIKLIDMWLIICQLFPFTQVMLLTGKEYLRDEDLKANEMEETKENKKGSVLGDTAQPIEPNQEAWANLQTKDKHNSMENLLVIGKLVRNYNLIFSPFFRKESDALGGPCCSTYLFQHCSLLLLQLEKWQAQMRP